MELLVKAINILFYFDIFDIFREEWKTRGIFCEIKLRKIAYA